jgi:hypothetical protein
MLKTLASLTLTVIFGGLLLAHGDYTHLSGTVTAIDGEHLSIKDTNGKPVIVMTHNATKYSKDNKPATSADLKVGLRVVIDAKMDEAMKMYKADEVKIGVAAPVQKK